ncbi:MAG TPA: VIT domain-containing protein, partial [Blastocatellia bacterium]|nr:VIT domain-containing protein [Blastocatellia bacterium]
MTDQPRFDEPDPEREPVSEPAAVEASPVERLIATRAELETAPEESVQPLFNVIEPRPGGYRLFLLLFGVVLPLISFTIELLTRISANELFDPMPTYWQVLAVAAVPAANLWAWRELRRPEPRYSWLLGGANGLALGVSVYYTILFLPLIPIGVVAVVFAGLGLLPLTPPLALIVTLIAARDLWDLRRRQNAEGRHWPVGSKSFWAGAALALISLVALELRTAVTRYHLQQAASGTPEARLRGLQRLRIMGNEELLLHACYYGFQRPTDLISFWFSLGDPVTAVQAREVYYRVTGRTFDSVPTPARNKQALLDVFDFNEDSDFGVGGREVGGILPGLSLAESRMDGSIDPDAALGYLEWTMVFRNSKGWQQEARAQVALPPGGTVSRLTLWVDGEEREAAFAARSKVQAAYENVVRQRRDPVLVTSSGDDRIMIQCFPVPPNGEMKIRFGITAPLYLPQPELGTLRLPGLLERNFGLDGSAWHSIWVESKGALESSISQLARENPRPELHALRGTVTNDELAKSYPTIHAHRSARIHEAWTRDPQGRKGELIQQRLEATPVPVPARVAIVVDGSSGMRQSAPAIAEALAKMPDQIEFGVW